MAQSSPLETTTLDVDVPALLQDESRIALVAQPIVDLVRARIVGYEALARFTLERPTPPDRVFQAAGRLGLAEELEAVVVRRALGLARQMPPNCFLTINIDPQHVASPIVQEVIATRADLRGIVLELTEHRPLDDMSTLLQALAGLRRRGALIAVDDAGSGYSGLKQILELRPQLLKVDRALITGVQDDEAKRALIQMLGELAGRLDAWLLAEGIETEAELHVLRQLGVPLAQGYFLGRPAPPWSELSEPGRAALVRGPAPAAPRATLASLIETCSLCFHDAPWPENERLCVRMAADSTPTGMRLSDAFGDRVRESHELLKVKASSPLSAVARRAAARPETLRWDPLVCINERGELEGVVRLQRLLCALADVGDATNTARH